jgi:3-methyladenine DNA glycosylase AlkD
MAAAAGRKPKPRATLEEALDRLARVGTTSHRDGYARYGIVAPRAYGVPMAEVQAIARSIAPDHALAAKLWASGWYEARLLAAFVDVAEEVTPAQMDRWIEGFDNWAVCDTVCFKLFDRTPHAFGKVKAWARRKPEFERRAAFALLASLAGHAREADAEEALVAALPLCEAAADDERNFVKKAVSWAMRSMGCRSARLHAAVIEVAERIEAEGEAGSAARWIGKDVLRDLRRPLVARKLAGAGAGAGKKKAGKKAALR